MRELYNFTIKKEDGPVGKLYAMEDLGDKLNNAGISVDDNTLYTCFVSALPAAEYALKIRDLNLKQIRDRKINLVCSKYETFGKSNGSSDSLAPIGKGRSGYWERGGKAHGGRGKSGNRKEGNGNANSNGGAGKANFSIGKCFRCRAAGHYSERCTAAILERCVGGGHQIDKCASPADMDESAAEAVLAMVEDLEDDAVEATMF